MLLLQDRIASLIELGNRLHSTEDDQSQAIIRKAEIENPWFSKSNIELALSAIRTDFLSKTAIDTVVNHYKIDDNITHRKVGLVLAGNIPMVGWHDVMCTYLVGYTAQIKYAEKDKTLMSWLIETLMDINEGNKAHFEIVDRLKDYDAAIATGSNNTATHFEYYFSHVPNIIRRNRNSVALLSGKESVGQLSTLGEDVFTYFGLGCRNVSMILVPHDYELSKLFEAWEPYKELAFHNKYKNNFDYNVALNLLNLEVFLHNDFILLKESESIISRISTVHIRRYHTIEEATSWIKTHSSEIQCVVSTSTIEDIDVVPFGESQHPGIMTYADGVDTIQFLISV